MTPKDYILSTLEELKKPVIKEDIGSTPLEDAIYAKVMSKKFRKLKADEATINTTKNAIHTAVSTNQPVTVSFLFGGNKLWRFEEAPNIDWAELFAVTYFVEWMKTIASIYPNVKLDFYSEDVAVEKLNNVTLKETAEYTKTFRSMLEWIKPYLPKEITITYRRYGEEYKTYEDYLKELEEAKKKHLEQNGGNLPTLNDAQKAATELNVRLLPGQADDPLWREKTELTHRSLEETPTLARYFEDPLLIMACPGWYSGWIAVGSTKRSYAKFWVGVGALQKEGDSYAELVLTPKQLEEAKFVVENIEIEGLSEIGKNFHKIRILK